MEQSAPATSSSTATPAPPIASSVAAPAAPPCEMGAIGSAAVPPVGTAAAGTSTAADAIGSGNASSAAASGANGPAAPVAPLAVSRGWPDALPPPPPPCSSALRLASCMGSQCALSEAARTPRRRPEARTRKAERWVAPRGGCSATTLTSWYTNLSGCVQSPEPALPSELSETASGTIPGPAAADAGGERHRARLPPAAPSSSLTRVAVVTTCPNRQRGVSPVDSTRSPCPRSSTIVSPRTGPPEGWAEVRAASH